jgi:hypothetical protein
MSTADALLTGGLYQLVASASDFSEASRAAGQVVEFVARYGNAVTVNATVSCNAIVDTNSNAFKRALEALPLDTAPQGQPALFFFDATTPDSSVDIRTITWDGNDYNAAAASNLESTDSRVMRSVLAFRQSTR